MFVAYLTIAVLCTAVIQLQSANFSRLKTLAYAIKLKLIDSLILSSAYWLEVSEELILYTKFS